MDFKFDIDPIDLHNDGIHEMMSSNGDVGAYLIRRGEMLALAARRDVGKDTGRLAASITVTFYGGPAPFVMVGSDLDYAYYVHEGTRPHEILPEPGRIMRFKIRGRVVYAQEIHHPGTKGDPFLERHLRKVLND